MFWEVGSHCTVDVVADEWDDWVEWMNLVDWMMVWMVGLEWNESSKGANP